MSNTTNQRKALANLEQRLNELEIDRQTAEQRLSETRERVIKGRADLLTLEPPQTSLNTVNDLIADVEQQIEELRNRIADSVAADRRSSLIRELLTCDLVCEKAEERIIENHKEFAAFADKSGKKDLSERNVIENTKTRAEQILNEIVPGATSSFYKDLPEVEEKLRLLWEELKQKGAKLSVLRSQQIFAHHHFRALDDFQAYNYPKLPYPQSFRLMVQESIAHKKIEPDSNND